MTPGTYSRPAEPMPLTRPNLAPFADTHSGPLGPSTTCGMRSFSAAEAFLVKRSGGSQIRSTWPSAEMTSYFMARSSERDHPSEGRESPAPYGIAQRYMRAQLWLGVASSTATVESDRIRPIGRIASLPATNRMSRL